MLVVFEFRCVFFLFIALSCMNISQNGRNANLKVLNECSDHRIISHGKSCGMPF